MSNQTSLFSIFNLPDCTRVSWSNTPPKLIDLGKGHSKAQPEYLCSFHFKYCPVDVFAQFVEAEYHHHATIYLPDYPWILETGDFAVVAQAIADIKLIQYSDILLNKILRDAVGDVSIEAIAAYRHSTHLRKAFPRLDEFINQTYADGGYIYLLDDQQRHYKVGLTKSIDRRLMQLGTQPPFKLKLLESVWVPHARRIEKWLHGLLKEHRLNGEWFEIPDDELSQARHWYADTNQENQNVIRGYNGIDWSQWRTWKESGRAGASWMNLYYNIYRPEHYLV